MLRWYIVNDIYFHKIVLRKKVAIGKSLSQTVVSKKLHNDDDILINVR